MTALIMVVSGCLIVVTGLLTLTGRRAAYYRRPRAAGWGAVAMGAGLGADGVPRLAGWSSGTGLAVATAGLVLVLLGVVLQLRGRLVTRPRRPGRSG